MKDRILPDYPEALINLKRIRGLDGIREEGGFLRIGALTRIEDIAVHPRVRECCSALAQAAHRTASPHLREMGTIGGNLCQDIRCWYYRSPDNRFPCLRKGGGRCYAHEGDNRYHSIFGASVQGGCIAVHPSDIAPALIALGAELRTSKRSIDVERFFRVDVSRTTVLESDEVVTAVHVPIPGKEVKSAYLKFAHRKSIDFPIVNCAARIATAGRRIREARVCLNAVYVTPYRVKKAEEALIGRELNDETAQAAGDAAVSNAKPVRHNRYMVEIARVLVQQAALACR
jgi:xanthine dehydrogenase YagS FAD-binding subunit